MSTKLKELFQESKTQPPRIESIGLTKLLFRPRKISSPNQSRRLISGGLVAHYPLHVEMEMVVQGYISEILQAHQSYLSKGDDKFAIAVYWGNPVRIEIKPLERLRRLQDSHWRGGLWKLLGDRAETYNPTKHINIGYISGDGLSATKLCAIVEA
jgi:hypothetical protein